MQEENIDILSSTLRRRCLRNPSVHCRWEGVGSLSQPDTQDVLFYLRMRRGACAVRAPYLTVVSRLTTRRNVYDVFNRAPRSYTVSATRVAIRRVLSAERRPDRRIAHFPHNHRANLFQRYILCPAGVVCIGSQALSPDRVARLRQSCRLITGWDRQKNGSGIIQAEACRRRLCCSNRDELNRCLFSVKTQILFFPPFSEKTFSPLIWTDFLEALPRDVALSTMEVVLSEFFKVPLKIRGKPRFLDVFLDSASQFCNVIQREGISESIYHRWPGIDHLSGPIYKIAPIWKVSYW